MRADAPVRDPASSSYVGTYHGCRELARLSQLNML